MKITIDYYPGILKKVNCFFQECGLGIAYIETVIDSSYKFLLRVIDCLLFSKGHYHGSRVIRQQYFELLDFSSEIKNLGLEAFKFTGKKDFEPYSHFTKKELKQWFNTIISICEDGFLLFQGLMLGDTSLTWDSYGLTYMHWECLRLTDLRKDKKDKQNLEVWRQIIGYLEGRNDEIQNLNIFQNIYYEEFLDLISFVIPILAFDIRKPERLRQLSLHLLGVSRDETTCVYKKYQEFRENINIR
ncbi:MAG: hypothetical protein GY730_01685 [bacterium]|nr:hypothetical protein [bacterium]